MKILKAKTEAQARKHTDKIIDLMNGRNAETSTEKHQRWAVGSFSIGILLSGIIGSIKYVLFGFGLMFISYLLFETVKGDYKPEINEKNKNKR